MQLKDKDIDILTTVSNLRFMTTQQVHAIHGYSGKYGENVTRRKLKELEDNGYLKSWQPDKYSSKIFYLTKDGAKEVQFYHGYDTVKTFQKSRNTLHQVMVTEVFVQLKKLNIGRLRRFAVHSPIGELLADALIEYQIDNSIKLKCLEADRAMETLQVITVKLEEYKRVYETEEWQSKYGIFPEVAFITSTEARKRSLLRLKEQYPMRIKVLTLDELRWNPAGFIS